MSQAMQIDRLQHRVSYTVEVLVTGDHDYDLSWRSCGEHVSHSRAAVALDEWLHETDPPSGEYRARDARDGYTVSRRHTHGQVA